MVGISVDEEKQIVKRTGILELGYGMDCLRRKRHVEHGQQGGD